MKEEIHIVVTILISIVAFLLLFTAVKFMATRLKSPHQRKWLYLGLMFLALISQTIPLLKGNMSALPVFLLLIVAAVCLGRHLNESSKRKHY